MSTIATETWTGADAAAWPAQWTTRVSNTSVVDIQSNAGRLLAQGGAYSECNASLSGMSATADANLLLTFTLASGGEQYAEMYLRQHGTWSAGGSPDDCYSAEVGNDGGNQTLSILKHVSGVQSSLVSDQVFNLKGVTWGTSAWWLRFQTIGTTLRVRVWQDGDPEPTTWDLSTTDSSHATGKAGFQLFNGADSAAKTFTVDDLTISTSSADTRNKRFAAMGWGDLDWIAPTPDGDLTDDGDKEQLLGLWPGFELSDTPPAPSGPNRKQRGKRRDRR